MPEDFNIKKFEQVLHYIISKCADKPSVGQTVLYKMLYFSDFDFYEMNERSLTYETYKKIPHGPAPYHFDPAIKELKEKRKICETRPRVGPHTQIRFLPTEEPSLDLLTANEIKHIDSIIDKLSGMNATQIIAYAHRDLPVKATEENNDIDYELVFYRDDMFSVREYDDDTVHGSARLC